MAASISSAIELGPGVTEDEKERLRVFGMRVRLARTARQWSQQDLGRRSGVTRNAVSSVERADGEVSLVRAWRLAAGLGVSLPDLIDPNASLIEVGLALAAQPNGSNGPARADHG